MPNVLVAPFVYTLRWLEEHPAARLACALALFGAAIALPLPGWALDAWLILSLGGALGLAFLVALVGDQLPADTVLDALPAYLQRFTLHRLALSLAITKAILLGGWAGLIVEWTAHQLLQGHVGLGLAVVGTLSVARWSLAAAPGAAHENARPVLAILGRGVGVSAGATLAFVASGLLSGLGLHRWGLGPTLASVTLYSMAEAVLAGLSALAASLAVGRWLWAPRAHAIEATVPRAPARAERGLTLEVGAAIAPLVGRSLGTQVGLVRARLERALGFTLPEVTLVVRDELPPRAFRWLLRGAVERQGELGEADLSELVALELERLARSRADALLSLDATHARLEALAAQQPVLVAHALAEPGLSAIHGVLRGLLRERVPVSDLAGILEALVAPGASAGGPAGLLANARLAQAWALGLALADAQGEIATLELAPGWDEWLASHPPGDPALASAGELARTLERELGRAVALAVGARDSRLALVVPRRYRARLAEMVYHGAIEVAVLAADELAPRCTTRLVGLVACPSLHPVA